MGLKKADIFRDVYDLVVAADLSAAQEVAVWRAVMGYVLDDCIVDSLEGNARRVMNMLMPALGKEVRKQNDLYRERKQRAERAREARVRKRAAAKAEPKSNETIRKGTARQFVEELLSHEATRNQLMVMARITEPQLNRFAREIIAEWEITKEDKVPYNSDNRAHFINLIRIKANISRNGNDNNNGGTASAVADIGNAADRHDDSDNILRRGRRTDS